LNFIKIIKDQLRKKYDLRGNPIITNSDIKKINRLVYFNRELNSKKIKQLLNLDVSERTIQRIIHNLGWRKIRTRYCQIVSSKNRIERLIYARHCKFVNEKFDNCIFEDETTVELRYTSFKRWYKKLPDENKNGSIGKYAHNIKVHVLGAISRRGASGAILFKGKLNSPGFINILDMAIIPFITNNFTAHRFIMDGAPCHTAYKTKRHLIANHINQFKVPAQSPVIFIIKSTKNFQILFILNLLKDLNPIELVWNDLKYYLAHEVKPLNENQLIAGILHFWREKVTVEYCNKKIDHVVNTVLDEVIRLKGEPTGL
jgi:hypothetical protein